MRDGIIVSEVTIQRLPQTEVTLVCFSLEFTSLECNVPVDASNAGSKTLKPSSL